jgi:hypothetical protein
MPMNRRRSAETSAQRLESGILEGESGPVDILPRMIILTAGSSTELATFIGLGGSKNPGSDPWSVRLWRRVNSLGEIW